MKTTTVTRITPEGAQLTDGTGRAIRVGDIVATSAALTLATPDGSSGCVSVTAPLLHPIARGRYVVRADAPRAPVAHNEPAPVTARPDDVSP